MALSKIILVVGSAKGLGAYLAQGFAEQGATVVFHARQHNKRCRSPFVTFDVRDRAAVERAVKKIIKKYRRIDVLINCVGPYTPKRIDQLTEKEWRNDLESGLHGAFFLSRAVLPQMRKQKSGCILHIGDKTVKGLKTSALAVAYKIAKNGLATLVHALQQTESKHGIQIHLLKVGILPNSIVKPSQKILAKIPQTSFESVFKKIEKLIVASTH